MVHAEWDLARARVAGDAGDSRADELFNKAIAAHGRVGSPDNLAQALLDQAEFLAATGESGRADRNVVEAKVIAETLGARTVVHRADAFIGAVGTSSDQYHVSAPGPNERRQADSPSRSTGARSTT